MLLAIFALGCAACGRSSFNRIQQNEHGMSEPKKNASPIVYVALGDSTGAGVGAREGGYVARIFTRLEREHGGSRLINLCVSGAATNDLLRTQLDAAIKARPTLLSLGIGINDIRRGLSIEEFAQNYETIVARLRNETSAPLVVTNIPDIALAPAVPVSARDELRRRINLFNERIDETAKRHGALVFDVYNATRDMIGDHTEFFSSDGFHPSDAGYEYWAKVMWPTIKSAVGE
ncbi:MAG: SGNH/GDSL hydrolase family protein [Pyrinomonadaceae bacterium]